MIKLLYRIPVHLLTLVVIKIPLQLLSIPVLFIYFRFFNDEERIRMPKYIKWFGIWSGKSYGINGDAAWRYARKKTYKKWKNRFQYNALRNPMNYFQWEVLGKKSPKGTHNLYQKGLTFDSKGWYYMDIEGTGLWELYIVVQYPKTKHALRIRMGYKIGDTMDLTRRRLQWAFSVTPWKKLK